jgi:nicotinamidase-related amidase
MFDPATTVLIPIDMQGAFDAPPWPRRWNQQVDANGLALLAAWRAIGAPIIHVRHDSVQPGSTLAPGQPGNAFRPGFEPHDGEPVVSKSVNAAFIGTDLDLRLRRLGATRLVLFGISTDMCVSTTTRVASNLGCSVTLAEDACDCFDLPDPRGGVIRGEDIHAAHIATLGVEFCEVAKAADLIARIRARTAA